MNNLVTNGDYKYSCVGISKKSGELALKNDGYSIELSSSTISKYEVIHTEYGKNIIDVVARKVQLK